MDILEYLVTTIPLFQKLSFFLVELRILLNAVLPIFLLLIVLATIIVTILQIAIRMYRFAVFKKQKTVLLELIPPSVTNQEPHTTEQLFSLIHALGGRGTFISRLLGIKPRFSLEIVSTKHQGIRYLIQTSVKEAATLKQNLLSYLPQLTIRETIDYVPQTVAKNNERLIELSLARHFIYPLKKQNELDEHDPIAYITGMMSKLLPGELIALQIVLSPVVSREAKKIAQQALNNKDILSVIENQERNKVFLLVSVLKFIFTCVSFIFTLPVWLIGNLATDGNTPFPMELFPNNHKLRQETTFEKDVVNSIYAKASQPLFEASIRLVVMTDAPHTLDSRLKGIVTSFSSFNSPQGQTLVSKKPSFFSFMKSRHEEFSYRLPSLKPAVLSVSEVSDLYHFPHTRITKTEDIVKTYSKQLPAPLSLKRNTLLDVTFAQNTYGGTSTSIGLTEEERRRHVYILGATGTGKTTLLLSMLNQDIQKRKGVCLIDPHGDLAESLLPLIPKDRVKDVIYFNPDDSENPIALNLLELPNSPGATEAEKLRDQEFITESIISLFNKLYPDHTARPRMEYILRNTIYTAFLTPNPTIFTILKLLVDAPFRRTVVKKLATLPDKNLYNFWKYEFNKAGDYQKVSMIMPITNKIGRFQFSPTARGILEQEKSKIDFENIMDSGKILICNVSKGRLGEDISEMFGILLLTKIQLAALRRAKKKIADRKDFYLYVDEFQNFATPAFAQILSEARKYRLNAILAHQTVSQIEDRSLVNVTLANAGTVICFRTANPLDEELMLPQFVPHIDQGEISNLPSYHFFMKVSAIEPQMPFSGETLPVKIPDDREKVANIIESSREQYSTHINPVLSAQEQEKDKSPKPRTDQKSFSKAKRKLH